MSKLVRLSILVIVLLLFSQIVTGATQRTLDDALRMAIDDVCPTQDTVPLGLGSSLNQYCEDRKLFSVGIPSDPAGASGSSTSPQQSRQLLPNSRDTKDAEIEHGKWTLFATARIEQIDKDLTQFEPAFNSDVSGVTVGIDYQLRPELNVGLAVTHRSQDGDFVQNGGQFEVVDVDFLIFGFYRNSDGGFIDSALSFTQRDIESTRRFLFDDTTANNALLSTDTLVSSENEASALFFNLRGGKDWPLSNGITVGVSSALLFEQQDIDSFTETGDTALTLSYLSQDEEKLTGEALLFGSMVHSMSWGVMVPQITLAYQHEFLDDQRDIRAIFSEDLRDEPTEIRYSNDPPDRNYFRLNIGTSVNFENGMAAFIDYSKQFAYDDFDRNAISFGLRKEL